MAEQTKKERLAELRKSISEMSDDELYEEIGVTRNNRHAPPEKKAKKTKAKKEKKSDLDSALDDLSPEQAAALLKQLKS